MSCGIYKITNKINGKCYIGQSIHIESRWGEEKRVSNNPKSKSYNTVLSRAFRRYGIENFNFEILEECPVELLNEKEIYYINYYNSYFEGYNSTTGGQGCQGTPLLISKEQLLEIYDLLQNSNMSQGEIAKKYHIGEDVISTINQGKSRRLPGYTYPLREREKNTYYCVDCGKEIVRNATRCRDCYVLSIRKVKDRPSKEKLFNLLKENQGSFIAVRRMFGVADNTVRKWCKSYGLPFHTPDYKEPNEPRKIAAQQYRKVAQIDLKTSEIIKIYPCIADANRAVNGSDHISAVCKGKRKSCAGFGWKYIN